MITYLFCSTIRDIIESGLIRRGFVLALMAWLLFRLCRTIRLLRSEDQRKTLRIVRGVMLCFEALCCFLWWLPSIAVPLEYVGGYETAQEVTEVKWDVLDWSDVPDKPSAESLRQYVEQSFGCELQTLSFEPEKYSYLLVLGRRNVSLKSSLWDMEFNNTIPPTSVFFWGHLSSPEKALTDSLFIFRFPRFPIVHYGRF